jgi:hypothetical protein
MKDFKNTIWKTLAANKNIKPVHFVQRAILIALASKSNTPKVDVAMGLLAKYFSPITNKNKLANGQSRFGVIQPLLFEAQYSNTILGVNIDDILETAEEKKAYIQLLKEIDTKRINRKTYVYYFTLQEGLTAEQQGVQAGHALFTLGAELAKKRVPLDHESVYFKWIGVKSEGELLSIPTKHPNVKYVKFNEPDLGNALTSIAFYPIQSGKTRDFLDYNLLSH